MSTGRTMNESDTEMKTVSDTDHTETGTTVETGMGGTMNGSGTETKTMRAEDLMEIGAIAGMAIAGTLNRSGTESKSTCAGMVLAPPSADRDITETTNDEIPQGVKYAPLN